MESDLEGTPVTSGHPINIPNIYLFLTYISLLELHQLFGCWKSSKPVVRYQWETRPRMIGEKHGNVFSYILI